ncbi:MAG TPA: YsnF/AvaK domain-containing protein [Bryobacteraceae bacterium]|nr:YsnF/AvaK domain-containing protein [Bryobacteraceae bacterium]
MTYEKIVTLYDTAGHAADARRSLEAAGFAPSDISTLTTNALGGSGEKLSEPGIWHRLFGRSIEPHEAAVYGRVVGSGGAVLTIRVPESDVPRALGILNSHRAVDVQHRAVQEGLLSSSASSIPATAPPKSTMAPAARAAAGEEVLRLAEEQLEVGKRLVQEGTTRIRRFVVETPVEQQITLHEEHARVIRRAVSDLGTTGNIDWTDKTIEINEMVEEPVVTKSAHIAEEVVIQKESTDQVKTLKDKVRRQQVEVERTGTKESLAKK